MSLVRDPAHLRELLQIPFSDQQLAAITAPPQVPQAIIAGAGSGKTAVMAARVVWLVGHVGIAPDRILGLTFTTKAAGELAARVRSSLEATGDFSEAGEPTVSTYHAFAGTLISEHGPRLGVEPDLRVMADATRFQIAARTVRAHAGSLDQVSAWLPTVLEDVLALDAALSEHLVPTEMLRDADAATLVEVELAEKPIQWHHRVADTCRKRIELSLLVDEYRAAKREAGVMDFSDQMAWGARLAALPEVGASLRERFDVVLLDEYQDTSVAQRDLLRALFAGGPISAVGDPAQGIYGWRGAASGNLTGFLDDFPDAAGHRGQPFTLNVTRRCAPQIIDLANAIAAPFYASPEAAGVQPLAAAPGNLPGRVTVALHPTVSAEIDALVDFVHETHAAGVPLSQIGVLVRTTNENGEIVRGLRAAGLPVEIVGLTGLLAQPEVVDVLAVLAVLDDVTANAATLRLLTGARFRIGDRDLVLLGRRAADLGRPWSGRADADATDLEAVFTAALDEATAGIDPTEVVSLAEAVDDPGDLPYSDEARARFADLAGLAARLRHYLHEPLLDLARRVVNELDLDVELAVAGIPTDNLTLLMDAVADYAQHDRYASLTGLMAYLRAESDFNEGMELSAPSQAESVKLLTIHKAKGLEFDAVAVPFVAGNVFPSGQGRDRWPTVARAVPAPLRGDADSVPQLREFTSAAEKQYALDVRAESTMEEVRLAYVAFTRARTRLHVSGHHWGRTQLKPRAVSAFLLTVRDWLAERGVEPDLWAPDPEPDEANPHLVDQTVPWPATILAPAGRRELAEAVQRHLDGGIDAPPLIVDPRLEHLRTDLDLLLDEARRRERPEIGVSLPGVLSATAVMRWSRDPEGFARDLARPMPRRPSPAARFGTRFHAWVESRCGQQTLLDPDELPGRGDVDIADEADLDALRAAFEAGPFAARVPVGVEVPFTLRLGGQQVIGRIDAVFAAVLPDGRDGFEVVDWKTNARADADPLQLAIYRVAWAEQQGVDPSLVVGTFHYVRRGESVSPADLPGRAGIEALLGLR